MTLTSVENTGTSICRIRSVVFCELLVIGHTLLALPIASMRFKATLLR